MPEGQWYSYLLGMALAAASAWISYCWRDLVREAPRAFRDVVSGMFDWRSSYLRRLLSACSVGFWFWVVIAQVTILIACNVAVAYAIASIWWPHTAATAMPYIPFALIGVVITEAAFIFFTALFVAIAYDRALFMQELVEFRSRAARYPLPVMIWGEILLVPIIGRLLLRLFVAVHTHEALDVALYAGLGTLVGALTTHTLMAATVSFVAGFALAFIGRLLARLVPSAWVAH
jgi:hypothetical protein